jgi:hypothetical protein
MASSVNDGDKISSACITRKTKTGREEKEWRGTADERRTKRNQRRAIDFLLDHIGPEYINTLRHTVRRRTGRVPTQRVRRGVGENT